MNRPYVKGAVAGNGAIFGAEGSDANVALLLKPQGSGSAYVISSGGTQFEVFDSAGSVNWIAATGAAAGSMPRLQATGSDADIDLRLSPKGSGYIRFGVFSASGDVAVNGYVTIKDASGNIRKLATVA